VFHVHLSEHSTCHGKSQRRRAGAPSKAGNLCGEASEPRKARTLELAT
jgi:hypothetical protein